MMSFVERRSSSPFSEVSSSFPSTFFRALIPSSTVLKCMLTILVSVSQTASLSSPNFAAIKLLFGKVRQPSPPPSLSTSSLPCPLQALTFSFFLELNSTKPSPSTIFSQPPLSPLLQPSSEPSPPIDSGSTSLDHSRTSLPQRSSSRRVGRKRLLISLDRSL